MNYCDIKSCDVVNGKGVRVSLFVSGCENKCEGCFNPEAWDPEYGEVFTDETLDRVLRLLDKPFIQGLSILGGDPFFPGNRKDVSLLCKKVKNTFKNSKDIWVYTGYLYEDILDYDLKQRTSAGQSINGNHNSSSYEFLRYIDVLVDGPFDNNQKSTKLAFKGSENQRIIDVKRSINANKIILYDF